MSKQELELPKGWVETNIGVICKNHDHQRIPISAKKRKQIQGKIPYYGASGIIDYVEKPIFSGEYFLIGEDGANLISRSTPVAFIVKGEFWVNNHAHILSTYGDIPLEFLVYYIAGISLNPWISGSAQPKLNQENLKKIPVPLPPLNEQKRIVSKIEELFSKIDSTKQSLEQTKLQLELYRQSLLKSAFEGNLTEQWRTQNHHNSTETQQTKELPNTWKFYKISEICKTSSGGTPSRKNPKNYIGNINWIKSGELNDSYILKSEEKISKDALKNSSAKIFPKNTVVLAMYGATIGKIGILRIEAATNQAICAFFIDEKKIRKTFLFYYLMSIRAKLLDKGSGGAQDNLSQTIINDLSIPITSLEEQEQIVSQIEQGFSLIENTQNIVNSTLQTLQTMKMSVLKNAFEGKLVPQDPNDEPAEKLLERIKKEKS